MWADLNFDLRRNSNLNNLYFFVIFDRKFENRSRIGHQNFFEGVGEILPKLDLKLVKKNSEPTFWLNLCRTFWYSLWGTLWIFDVDLCCIKLNNKYCSNGKSLTKSELITVTFPLDKMRFYATDLFMESGGLLKQTLFIRVSLSQQSSTWSTSLAWIFMQRQWLLWYKIRIDFVVCHFSSMLMVIRLL